MIERILEPVPGLAYPVLVQAKGRCPPEDCGGPWGYADFIEALGDPGHERHEEMITWIGQAFDPSAVDVSTLAADVESLAKRWSRKPAGQRKG